MNNVILGIISGIAFALVAVASMIPLKFPDKRTALLGAFASRFAIGFLICTSTLPLPAWLRGLVISLLVSLPDAIVTKAYAPILGLVLQRAL